MCAAAGRRIPLGPIALWALLFLTLPSVQGQQARPEQQVDPAKLFEVERGQARQLELQWMAGPDMRLRAWAAFWILRDRETDLAPTLREQIAAYTPVRGEPSSLERDSHDAMLAVLDAVIQMHVLVPASDAARLYPEFPVQSLILMSRLQENAGDTLLIIFQDDHSQPGAWLAAGNLLLERRVPGFAAAVLRGLKVHAGITVTTGGDLGPGEGSGTCGDSFAIRKQGWPEIGLYAFVNSTGKPESDEIVLVPGRDSAYYIRGVNNSYLSPVLGSCNNFRDLDLVRQHYLEALLDISPSDQPPIKSSVNLTIMWDGEASYLAQVQALVDSEEAIFTNVAKSLEAHQLLTAEEFAAAVPKLELRIADQRNKPAASLPQLSRLPSNVTISFVQP
jgi:hypothetical protein